MTKQSKNQPKKMTQKKRDIDKDLIRELAELLTETGLTEIEFEHEGLRLRVAKTINIAAAAPIPSLTHSSHAQTSTPAKTDPQVSADHDLTSHPGAVPSPMVGTAYRAPEPGAAPFVEVGTQVTEGQTLMIVEAMKTMNHIPAPKAGTITAILVEDGQPVEYGEPLVIIE